MPPSLFASVGDLSGERAFLPVAQILHQKGVEIYGLTGYLTGEVVKSVGLIEDINATGLFEVIPKLPTIFRTKRKVENFLRNYKPDLLLAVDAPGFNLTLVKKAKALGVKKVAYFILPQVWAWKEERKRILEEHCDLLLSVVPFEKKIYKPKGELFYVGHPSLERLEPFLNSPPKGAEKMGLREDYFVVFPGSRKNEIKKHLKVLEKAIPKAVKEFGIPAVVLTFKSFKPYLRNFKRFARLVYLDENPSLGYELIRGAKFGWIKSGTTAFESAILNLPHLTFYRLGKLTYLIAKRLVKVPYIHLANLILEDRVVPELVQEELTVSKLLDETYRILGNSDYQKERFNHLRELLRPSEKRRTSELVAELLYGLINGS